MICDEYSEFLWPGVDAALTPGGEAAYGYAPDALVERIRADMRAAIARGGLKGIVR